jgi:hypothetical protein
MAIQLADGGFVGSGDRLIKAYANARCARDNTRSHQSLSIPIAISLDLPVLWAKLFGNPIGRWWIRWLWRSVDKGLEDMAQYGSDPKMEKLRPENR